MRVLAVLLVCLCVCTGVAKESAVAVGGSGAAGAWEEEQNAVRAFLQYRERAGPLHTWGGEQTAEFLRALRVGVPEEVLEQVAEERMDADDLFDVFVNNPTTSEECGALEEMLDEKTEAALRRALRAIRRWVIHGARGISFWEVRAVDTLSTFDTSVVGICAGARTAAVWFTLVTNAGGAEAVLRTDGTDAGLAGFVLRAATGDARWEEEGSAALYWLNWLAWPYLQALFALSYFRETDWVVFAAGFLPLVMRQIADWEAILATVGIGREAGAVAVVRSTAKSVAGGLIVTLLYSLVCTAARSLRPLFRVDFLLDILLYLVVLVLQLGAVRILLGRLTAFLDARFGAHKHDD
jgi:hypothetical protein